MPSSASCSLLQKSTALGTQGALNSSNSFPDTGVTLVLRHLDYQDLNTSLTVFSDHIQWYGDIFGQPRYRNETDVGLSVFRGSHKKEWGLLGIVVVLLLIIDFCCLKRIKGSSRKVHIGVLSFWVFCGFVYNSIVFARQGMDKAILWCSGYFLEWLLSMDNLFVFHLIFTVYATPKKLLHKALFMGIIGAIGFRMIFFMALASLLHLVHWFRFVFGALLIFSGIQAARDGDSEVDISNLCCVRWLKWCLGDRLAERYDLDEGRMFVVEDGKIIATLLALVVFCLELTDVIFAVDSVSAKVAEIPDYYIAYSSSVLAMFGLRAMFFILHDLVDAFDMLKYGLCFILVFIGIELLVEDFVRLPTQVVCIIILSVFLVCTAGSTAKGLFKDSACTDADCTNSCEAHSQQ